MPDTGGALFEATVLIRKLGQAHPTWIEMACFELLHSSHRGIRMALADALPDYIEPGDADLAARLVRQLAKYESESVRRRIAEPHDGLDRARASGNSLLRLRIRQFHSVESLRDTEV